MSGAVDTTGFVTLGRTRWSGPFIRGRPRRREGGGPSYPLSSLLRCTPAGTLLWGQSPAVLGGREVLLGAGADMDVLRGGRLIVPGSPERGGRRPARGVGGPAGRGGDSARGP